MSRLADLGHIGGRLPFADPLPVPLLALALGVFIASNLTLGITYSTISSNQMQSMQLAQFTLMPSIMFSGFMFPFKGMPVWAQWIGEVFDHACLADRA